MRKGKRKITASIILLPATQTAAVVLVNTHGTAVIEAPIRVLSGGLCDVLEEHVGAHVVRVTYVPHQVLESDLSAIQ